MHSNRILILLLIGLVPSLLGDKSKGKGKGGGSSGDDPAPSNGGKTSEYDDLVNVLEFSRDVKADGDIVCKAFKASEGDLKLNMTEPLTYSEMLKMLTWTLKYDLKSGTKPLKLADDLKWKREVVEIMTSIFKKGCSADYVPQAFINIAKELYMVYLNSIKFTKNTKALWAKTLKTLKTCESKTSQIKMSSRGFFVEAMYYKDQLGQEQKKDIYFSNEIADEVLEMPDLIIDTVWWIFSYSFGTCYPFMENKAIEMAQFKKLFYNDFLYDLLMRWQFASVSLEGYGPIFGDFNLEQAILNLRYCVTAAYAQSGIEDRQLVRPFSMIPNPNTTDVVLNRRVG